MVNTDKVYTWDEVIEIQKQGVKASCLPFGEHKDKKFAIKPVLMSEIPSKFYGRISKYEKHGIDESVVIIERILRAMKNGEAITPVVLDSNFNVIDGSHRLSAYKEKGRDVIRAFVAI